MRRDRKHEESAPYIMLALRRGAPVVQRRQTSPAKCAQAGVAGAAEFDRKHPATRDVGGENAGLARFDRTGRRAGTVGVEAAGFAKRGLATEFLGHRSHRGANFLLQLLRGDGEAGVDD